LDEDYNETQRRTEEVAADVKKHGKNADGRGRKAAIF
jgi:hypothetical protein